MQEVIENNRTNVWDPWTIKLITKRKEETREKNKRFLFEKCHLLIARNHLESHVLRRNSCGRDYWIQSKWFHLVHNVFFNWICVIIENQLNFIILFIERNNIKISTESSFQLLTSVFCCVDFTCEAGKNSTKRNKQKMKLILFWAIWQMRKNKNRQKTEKEKKA